MSKDFQWYLTRDNFLSQKECEEVIEIIDNKVTILVDGSIK